MAELVLLRFRSSAVWLRVNPCSSVRTALLLLRYLLGNYTFLENIGSFYSCK